MSERERIMELVPAWDRRDDDPAKNYGIHGVELRMILRGPEGAVQFLVYTDWQLPHVQKELDARDRPRWMSKPTPADVGYHSPVPQYEGQEPMSDSCDHILGGGPCYYDGSGLRAQEWFDEILLPKGSHGIWEAMEEEYDRLFGGEES